MRIYEMPSMNSGDNPVLRIRPIVKIVACAFFFIFWVLLYLGINPSALAHDWYAPSCCNGGDCRPVPASEIEEIDWDHVRDLVTGQVMTGDKVKQSQDGQWHTCNRGGVRTNETLCVYRPVGSY